MAMRVLSDVETNRINNSGVFEFVNAIFGKTMHAKRVQSLANAEMHDSLNHQAQIFSN